MEGSLIILRLLARRRKRAAPDKPPLACAGLRSVMEPLPSRGEESSDGSSTEEEVEGHARSMPSTNDAENI